MVHPNTIDLYPEYPLQLQKVVPKIPRQNVWRKWKELDEQSINMSVMNDLTCEKLQPELFIKDEDELENITETLYVQFKIFEAFHKVMVAKSMEKFGFISYEAFSHAIFELQTKKEDKEKLPRSYIELSFMKATRTQKAKNLSG